MKAFVVATSIVVTAAVLTVLLAVAPHLLICTNNSAHGGWSDGGAIAIMLLFPAFLLLALGFGSIVYLKRHPPSASKITIRQVAAMIAILGIPLYCLWIVKIGWFSWSLANYTESMLSPEQVRERQCNPKFHSHFLEYDLGLQ